MTSKFFKETHIYTKYQTFILSHFADMYLMIISMFYDTLERYKELFWTA